MTAFALVGSTGKSLERGIGTYGLMASISGLMHMGNFFFLLVFRLQVTGKGMVILLKYSSFVSVLRVRE